MAKILLLDPEYNHITSQAHNLLVATLESAGVKAADCAIGVDEGAVLKAQPELIVCLGVSGARLLYGKGVTSEARVSNGVGKKGQELYREPNLTELRRRGDLEYGVPGLTFPVVVITPPASALARMSIMPGFVRDCQKVAERTGARQEVDQTRDYAVYDGIDITELLARSDGAPIALDTEYTQDGSLFCWSYAYKERWGRVVFPDESSLFSNKVVLRSLLDHAHRIVLHNAKADVPTICTYLGWATEDWPWDKTEDTIVQAYMLGKKPLALKSLAETELGLRVIRLEEITDGDYDLASVPREELVKYSAQDADLTLRLFNKFSRELSAA